MKNRKTIVALLLVAIVGLVGLTIAYFANSQTINNLFSTKEYGTTYIEEFVSPSNWLPGDTTAKVVTATNSGQVDEAVRISYVEEWIPNDANATLTGWIHADGTKSNHTTENELATDVRAAVINLANSSDWTKVGNYYYYNYKLAPNETTSSFIESVTFNPLTKLGDTCTESESNGTKTIACNSSREDYDNATYKLTLTIETVQYNKYKSAWSTDVAIISMKPMNVFQLALKSNPVSITNYTAGNVHEMYTFEHEVTSQTPALIDYRYIGNDPYNYVYFNCTNIDNQNSETCELWRIVGIFEIENEIDDEENLGEKKTIKELRIKLVRGNSISTLMKRNTYGRNNWTNSTLTTFLNVEYYNSLSIYSKEMIDNAKYYLGGIDSSSEGAEKMYIAERSSYSYYSNPVQWLGKIGLLYPSDGYMVYGKGVSNNCFNKSGQSQYCDNVNASTGWIYNSNIRDNEENIDSVWFISPAKSSDYVAFYANSYGYLSSCDSNNNGGIRPVVYLSSNVKIIGGTGEHNNPYWLGL